MESILTLLIIVASFTVTFGCMLFIITHYFFDKWQKEKISKARISLWMWRLTMLIIILFITAVLLINRNLVFEALTNFSFYFVISMLVFFLALVEIAIIDLLLPDSTKMWKRVTIEFLIFATLISVTMVIFSNYAPVFS